MKFHIKLAANTSTGQDQFAAEIEMDVTGTHKDADGHPLDGGLVELITENSGAFMGYLEEFLNEVAEEHAGYWHTMSLVVDEPTVLLP